MNSEELLADSNARTQYNSEANSAGTRDADYLDYLSPFHTIR
jgi:hypothetical protein